MRIIGEISHPTLKITVFKMGERTSVKLENAQYEQTFKLGTDERFQSVEDIQRWADGEFLAQALRQFEAMHQNKMAATQRAFPINAEAEFETII